MEDQTMTDPVLKEIYDSIINGQQKVTAVKVQQALDAGMDPATILNEAMVKAMGEVGRLFEEGE
jgi:5-methyltetrahydrofolate--homocysteine methyltransferase